jgi:hypothetical protein
MPFDHNLPDAAERFMQERAEEALARGCAVTVSGRADEVILLSNDPVTGQTKIEWRWSWDRRPRLPERARVTG